MEYDHYQGEGIDPQGFTSKQDQWVLNFGINRFFVVIYNRPKKSRRTHRKAPDFHPKPQQMGH